MKKLLSLILALVLTLTLFASCGKTEQALTSTELLDLGEKYLLDLDYEQAIVYFNQVIEVEPRNSRAYMGAAEAYVGLGDTESAIDILKTALDVFTDDEDVTIELLEMLIEIDSTNAEWYLELAQIYIDNNDRTSAISILKQGMSYVGDDKIKLYDKLIEIDSGTTEWYFELAEVYEDLSNISSAIDTLELGLNNFEDDDTKIDFSEELIEVDETNAKWYLTIAYIYIARGDTDAAIAILREGLEKASDTAEIEALLAELLLEEEPAYGPNYGVLDNDMLRSPTYFDKTTITEIDFLDSLDSAPADAWDFSLDEDGSVLGWLDGTHLYVAGDGGVIADEDATQLFAKYCYLNENGKFESVLQEINFNGCFDTSNVTEMDLMFYQCKSLTTLDLSGFDTSNVTDMSFMFSVCHSLESLDLSGFDTSNVKYMESMFNMCKSLVSLDISNFDTSKVVNMDSMFSGCESLTSLDVSNFDTSNVVYMNDMFRGCTSLTSLDTSNFDMSNADTSYDSTYSR